MSGTLHSRKCGWQTSGQRSIGRSRPRVWTRAQAGVSRAPVQSQTAPKTLQVGEAWVTVPPRRQRIRGLVHFLGGAFAGAAPQVLYSLLLDQLATAGFTVVSTPYAVTFKHLDCADSVRNTFLTTIEELRSDPSTSVLAPPEVPVFGVGHSNGSLLHLLIGSRHPGATQGNAIISYNNKDVSAAIPIPGFLGSISPAVSALRSAPLGTGLPLPLADLDAAQLMKGVASLLPPVLLRDEAGQVSRAGLALEQIGTVFGEVGDGVTDFTPSPTESRRLIQEGYSASQCPVLLVRFMEDSFDETPEMDALLRSANPTGVSSLLLPGTHVTPCGSDLNWQVGPVFTPVDALVSLAKWQSQVDIRRLGDDITQWLGQRVEEAKVEGMRQAEGQRQAAGESEAAVGGRPATDERLEQTAVGTGSA